MLRIRGMLASSVKFCHMAWWCLSLRDSTVGRNHHALWVMDGIKDWDSITSTKGKSVFLNLIFIGKIHSSVAVAWYRERRRKGPEKGECIFWNQAELGWKFFFPFYSLCDVKLLSFLFAKMVLIAYAYRIVVKNKWENTCQQLAQFDTYYIVVLVT